MSLNLLDLRHLRVGTKAEISAITNIRDGQFSMCTENRTLYTFVLSGASYIIDNEKVLESDVSTDSRWVYANINVPFGYVYEFDLPDWVLDADDNYVLTIADPNTVIQTDKTMIQLYDTDSNVVGVTNIGKDANGLYVLTTCSDPDSRFKGHAVIIPTNNL